MLPSPTFAWESDAKNAKTAQQFIDRQLATALKDHLSNLAPAALLFELPHESNLARMLRKDLKAARAEWLNAENITTQDRTRRQDSDFLAAGNHEGQTLDFHSLRHTRGAWLALSGAHLKTVQVVMRHSSITLTMDTYGHLLPGAEAEAADRLGAMVSRACAVSPQEARENVVTLSGSNGPQNVQRVEQRAGRESTRPIATACDFAGALRCNNNVAQVLRDSGLERRHASRCDVIRK
jgi:hypothetical protein